MAQRELHIESLLGRRVYDSKGKHIGHLEEVVASRKGDEWIVEEYWVGPGALLHRFSVGGAALAIMGLFNIKGHTGYKVPWDKIDFRNPKRLRLLCAGDELEELEDSEKSGRKRKRKARAGHKKANPK